MAAEQVAPAAAEDAKAKKQKAEKVPTASVGQLFGFAGVIDFLLMFVGMVAAAGTGAALPLFILFFSDLLDEVGSFATGTPLSFDTMLKTTTSMFFLGAGAHAGGWIYGTCFELSKCGFRRPSTASEKNFKT